jgi:hypothetical protein
MRRQAEQILASGTLGGESFHRWAHSQERFGVQLADTRLGDAHAFADLAESLAIVVVGLDDVALARWEALDLVGEHGIRLTGDEGRVRGWFVVVHRVGHEWSVGIDVIRYWPVKVDETAAFGPGAPLGELRWGEAEALCGVRVGGRLAGGLFEGCFGLGDTALHRSD